MPDLTTLSAVKSWLKIPTTTKDDDAVLSVLITQISASILAYIQRPNITRKLYIETVSGTGTDTMVLKNYPVLSIEGLSIDGRNISASSGYPSVGYVLETWDGTPPGSPQSISLIGNCFRRGTANVMRAYYAGYAILGESHTAGQSVYVDAPYGNWSADEGVTLNGVALTKVTGTPATGQYALGLPGQYIFSDTGTVLISYSYIPFVLENACVELVAERYKYKSRIGVRSQSIGGQETVSYNLSALPDWVKQSIAPFRRLVPL